MSAPDARSLFAAAREDGPEDGERDAMFREIVITTSLATATVTAIAAASAASSPATAAGLATSAAAAADGAKAASSAAAKSGGMFGFKLLAVGAALGAASTALGVLLAVTLVLPEASRGPSRPAGTTAPATVAGGAKLAQPDARKRDPADGAKAPVEMRLAAEPPASARVDTADGSAGGASDLAEEARLVTAARNALVAGDAARALALVQNTRKLSARALEPEELGLEARALRALGRADDAAATELVLRRRYPDHALAR